VIRTKTDEPIEMQLGLWTRVGPRNHELGGSPDIRGKGAILEIRPPNKMHKTV